MNDKKPYLFQDRLGACHLTALCNFITELKGRSPLKFESGNFFKIIRKCHKSQDAGGEYITPALEHLKLRLINLTEKPHNSLRLLKRQMVKVNEIYITGDYTFDVKYDGPVMVLDMEGHEDFKAYRKYIVGYMIENILNWIYLNAGALGIANDVPEALSEEQLNLLASRIQFGIFNVPALMA